MFGAESTHTARPNRIRHTLSAFQRAGWRRPVASSDNQQSWGGPSSTESTSGGSALVWWLLAGFFALLVLGYPSLLTFLGDFHGVRFLLRLSSSLMVLGALALVGGAIHWIANRNS